MSRLSCRVFECVVCAAALALPLIALSVATDSGAAAGDMARAPGAAAVPPASEGEAAAAAAAATVAAIAPARAPAQAFPYRTSWIGNTWGYGRERWVQHDVQAIAVAPDGDLYTNSLWDEAGGEIGHYRDGQLIGYGGESHGWGAMGGDAIAVNDRYVFAAQIISSVGPEAALARHLPSPGTVWFVVSRRQRSDIGSGAPFAGQQDVLATKNAYRVITATQDGQDYAIRGLAADATSLFVSDLERARIDVFDAETMQPAGSLPAREPGRLALAPDGSLWVIEGIRTSRVPQVVHHARNGARLDTLSLPPGVVPADLALDGHGRLYVADDGPRQQILIFKASNAAGSSSEGARMQLTSRLGEAGGIFAGRAGVPGPLRFNGLTGVGVDRAGNVYVAMNGWGPRGFLGEPEHDDGAVIESYAPDGTRRFSLQGLLFVDGADAVDGDPVSVYSGSKRFTLDLSKPSGAEWVYAGYTADRFRYPYDPMFYLRRGSRGMPLVRKVDGRTLLFTTDQTSDFLRIYRFRAGSEIAIPSGLFAGSHIDGAWPPNQPPSGEWIWRDTAGAGRFDADDFDQNAVRSNAPRLGAWWVDARATVWEATAITGIREFPLQGFDRSGNPVYRYAAMRTWPMPAEFTRVQRIAYVSAEDAMYVAGATAAHPFRPRNWNAVGGTLARYDHWTSAHPVLRYEIAFPDDVPPKTLSIAGIAVAGDYLFAAESTTGAVRVYAAGAGQLQGRLAPGPEVGGTSGWLDVSMPLTARRLASGEYLVFAEEDLHGKVTMYRFTPDETASAVSREPQAAREP